MYYTLRELSRWCEVHAIVMLDYASRARGQRGTARVLQVGGVRRADRTTAIRIWLPSRRMRCTSSRQPEIEWLIQRQILLHEIDVIQLEYTALGQYARRFQRLVCALFEHDVYFQSIGRALPFMRSPLDRLKARFEYLRAIRLS